MQPPSLSPLLLVSVRSPEEASLAWKSGAQIIDVKEPHLGSLGNAGETVIAGILGGIRANSPSACVSAAWGELRDFSGRPLDDRLHSLSYLKLGLSGMRADPDWRTRWNRTREQLFRSCPPGHPCPGWIAVAYVDELAAESPPVEDVIATAIASPHCQGVLFDTFDKSTGALVELVSVPQLTRWCRQLSDAKRMSITAGKVQREHISDILSARPSVIAVRSAACTLFDRNATIDPQAIQKLLQAIQSPLR